jgi:hypothetical protein
MSTLKLPMPSVLAVLVVLALSVRADILELKHGKFAGGTAGTVRFATGAGQQVIETSQINAALDLQLAASLPLIK